MMIDVIVDADPDQDDCLAAAVEEWVGAHPDAEGWDLSPRWEDERTRERVVLTVPVE